MVSLGSFKISFLLVATVLIFFTAGLLSLALRARRLLGAYRIPWRPAFSSHLIEGRKYRSPQNLLAVQSWLDPRVRKELRWRALSSFISVLGGWCAPKGSSGSKMERCYPFWYIHENKDAYTAIRIPPALTASQSGTSFQSTIRVYTEL